MNAEIYTVIPAANHCSYEFFSEGPNGRIKKVIFYQGIDDDLFNLAFGDWDYELKKINDKTRSNNNDRDKVFATVASTAIDFTTHYPHAKIFIKGSTESRTRLYQIAIFANLEIINQLYGIMGYREDK